MRLRVSDLEMALCAISIQNRAEVRKWAVGRGSESGDLQRSAPDDPLAESVQQARTMRKDYRHFGARSTVKIGPAKRHQTADHHVMAKT